MDSVDNSRQTDKKKLRDGLYLSLSLVLLMLIIKLVEINFNLSFVRLGLYPRRAEGIPGILLAPLIHKDLLHLFNNAVPLLVSIIGLFYFFRKEAFRILILAWLATHILVWVFARESYHIGASGLVYALLSFLFFVSTFANNKNLLAISLILIFLYGTMIWGILPVENHVSWESHLIGATMGLILAIVFRKKAPKPEKFDWEDEEEDIDELTNEEIDEIIDQKLKIKYWYKPGKKP